MPDTEGAAAPFFSPDGNWVAFFADRQLKRVPFEGGAPLVICDVPGRHIGGSWGSDDNHLLRRCSICRTFPCPGGGRPTGGPDESRSRKRRAPPRLATDSPGRRHRPVCSRDQRRFGQCLVVSGHGRLATHPRTGRAQCRRPLCTERSSAAGTFGRAHCDPLRSRAPRSDGRAQTRSRKRCHVGH